MTEEGNYIVKGETVPRIINPASLDDQSVSTGVITLVRMEFADIGIDIVRIASIEVPESKTDKSYQNCKASEERYHPPRAWNNTGKDRCNRDQ